MTTPALLPLPFFAKGVARQGVWKYVFLFLCGVLMTLALPPVGFFPILLFCLPAFITIARETDHPFLTGWAFGSGYFIFGLYWISAALFVDIQQWKWVLPLSLVAGPALLALFWGFIPLLAHRYRADKIKHAIDFIALFALIEFARGHLLTGFPWNLAGYTWHHAPALMQISSLTGIYGLTLLTLIWASLPVYFSTRFLGYTAIALFIAAGLFGFVRLHNNPTAQNGNHTLRIVQANVPQMMKWNPDEDWRNIEKHAMLSTGNKPASFVIWPETAVTSDLSLYPDISRYIGMKMPKGAIGLLGNLRISLDDNRKEQFHNSLVAIDNKGISLAAFDKFHLVPFGEYIPFRKQLGVTPIAAAISGIGDFTPGTGNRTLRVENMPTFSPLICYEVIFPRAVVDQSDRPEWMVNVTNDGWYGRTAGPYQHLEIARVRAIEEGLPLARAANTGISAVFDPLGRVVGMLPLQTEGTLDTILPAPLPPTIYARFGDFIFFVMALLWLSLGWVHDKRKRP